MGKTSPRVTSGHLRMVCTRRAHGTWGKPSGPGGPWRGLRLGWPGDYLFPEHCLPQRPFTPDGQAGPGGRSPAQEPAARGERCQQKGPVCASARSGCLRPEAVGALRRGPEGGAGTGASPRSVRASLPSSCTLRRRVPHVGLGGSHLPRADAGIQQRTRRADWAVTRAGLGAE